MAGNKIGGAKCRDTNIRKYGKDFYKKIGQIGGKNGHTGGFAYNPALAREAGRKGGTISKRGNYEKAILSKEEEERLDKAIREVKALGGAVEA